MKTHNYDPVVMGITFFKFQPDRIHGLEARIVSFFDMGSFLFFLIRLTWLCLDGFKGRGVSAEMRILSRFLLMTSSLPFACLGSF